MVDTNITFTIPEAKIQRVIDAMKGLYEIPLVDDEPEFTETQWAKEKVRRWIIEQVQRYENIVAKNAVNVQTDNELVS